MYKVIKYSVKEVYTINILLMMTDGGVVVAAVLKSMRYDVLYLL